MCNNNKSLHYSQLVAKDNRCIHGEAGKTGEVEEIEEEDLPF